MAYNATSACNRGTTSQSSFFTKTTNDPLYQRCSVLAARFQFIPKLSGEPSEPYKPQVRGIRGKKKTAEASQKWCRKQKPKVRSHTLSMNSVLKYYIGPSQAEILLRVTSGIAAELVKAHDANQTVSLNELRAKMSKKHGFGGVPRLVDIISAIPDDYKKALLPKLRARPIRTASGVRLIRDAVDIPRHADHVSPDCCRSCNV